MFHRSHWAVGCQLHFILCGLSLGQTYQFISTLHANVLCASKRLRAAQDICHHRTSEQRSRQSRWTPGESLRLPNRVLLFSSVTGTYECDGRCNLVVFLEDLSEVKD